MAYEGWLSYAGTEIINNARTSTYTGGAIGGQCTCLELSAALEDPPYATPAKDSAPWYDSSLPESAVFYGLLGTEIVGADTSTVAYQWTELLSDGGVPGAMRRASKEIQFKALAVAANQAGLSYGMGWLASALRGSSCRSDCTGDELCVLAACPTRPVDDPHWTPVNGSPTWPGFNQLQRSGYNTTLIDPPAVNTRYRLAGYVVNEVQFTLRIGTPYWYRQSKLIVRGGGGTPPNPGVYTDVIPNFDPWGTYPPGNPLHPGWRDRCPQPGSCLDDESAGCTPPLPPEPVALPPDPCFPNDPANNPAGKPTAHWFTAGRAIFSIPRGTGSDWGEKVPVFRLFTGALPWRRLMLRWYDNPAGRPCNNTLDPCLACAEVNIPYLPRSSMFVFDARTRSAYADCPGPGALVQPRMYGPLGGVFEWPVFECASALCCEVIADANQIAQDSWMEIHMATREDSI